MADMPRDEILALAEAKERQIIKGPRKNAELIREEIAVASDEERQWLESELDEEEVEERKLAVIARALRLLAGEMGEPVAVKALEWAKHDSAEMWRAETILGTYFVFAIAGGPVEWKFEPDSPSSSRISLTTVADVAAGKAAAQADYGARIRSALVSPPSRSYAEGVEDAAKWHDEQAAMAAQVFERARRKGLDHMCSGDIAAGRHRHAAATIRALAPKEG